MEDGERRGRREVADRLREAAYRQAGEAGVKQAERHIREAIRELDRKRDRAR